MSEPSSLEGVKQFMAAHLATHDELEVLLCLFRQADVDLQASRVAEELGLPEAACQSVLQVLCAHQLVRRASDGSAFRYCPANEALSRGVTDLERVYQRSRAAVIRLMSENAVQRVRSSAARAFPQSPGRRKGG